MKMIFRIFFLTFCLSISTFPQDLKNKAEQNPLDCVLYLIKTENKFEDRAESLEVLADRYWKSGRYVDALNVIEMIPGDSEKAIQKIRYANEYLKAGNAEEAARLVINASKIIAKDTWAEKSHINAIIDTLFELEKISEAIAFSRSLIDVEDSALALLQVAELLADKPRNENVPALIAEALSIIEHSEWRDYKVFADVRAANVLARIGKKTEAVELIKQVRDIYPSTEFVNTDKDEVFDLIVSCYSNLKEFDTAIQLRQVDLNSSNRVDLNKLAQLYLLAGSEDKAKALFLQIEQMQIKNDDLSDSEILNQIARKAIKEGDFPLALSSSKTFYSKYYQIGMVDEFIDANRPDLAKELLDFVTKDVRDMKTDDVETGEMSTSDQMLKADQLAWIAERLIRMKQVPAALKIINTIEKPYFRAQALANLALKQGAKNPSQVLDQALAIMRKNKDSTLDAGKYKVWGEIALAYSSIGQKNKSLEVFAEVFSKDKEIIDEGLEVYFLRTLSELGFYFQKADVKADAKVKKALRQVIKNWQEDH
jgi:tetratricopeptide (TPR) repeat protein